MKKLTIILVFLMAAGLAKAQEIVTDFYHENGKYFNFHNIVETSDNCLIVECPLFEEAFVGPDLGVMFYKFSTDGIVTDSLLIEIQDVPLRTMFDRDLEHPDNYVFAYFEKVHDTLLFRMKTIDKTLTIIGEENLVIDCSPMLFSGYSYDFFVDSFGDIIASYSLNDTPNEFFMTYFLRIGFDGMLKDRKEVPEIRFFDDLVLKHTGIYSESPLRYCYWGSNHNADIYDNPPIRFYVLDSLFNVVDEQRFYSYQNCFYSHNWEQHFATIDSLYYLHVNTYKKLDSNYYTIRSILLEKRNRNHEVTTTALFGTSKLQPEALRVIAIDCNTIYLSYMTTVGEPNHLVLLRLDGGLNIQWERHFLSEDMFHWATCMKVLQDGSIAVGSYVYGQTPGSISVVVFNDNYDSLEEQGIVVRPYTYYPNPVQDNLHLQYSPDVKPTSIELYDLQGRLLRTQRNGLGSLNMSDLPSGTYTMRVKMEDGKVFSDKIVKKS